MRKTELEDMCFNNGMVIFCGGVATTSSIDTSRQRIDYIELSSTIGYSIFIEKCSSQKLG